MTGYPADEAEGQPDEIAPSRPHGERREESRDREQRHRDVDHAVREFDERVERHCRRDARRRARRPVEATEAGASEADGSARNDQQCVADCRSKGNPAKRDRAYRGSPFVNTRASPDRSPHGSSRARSAPCLCGISRYDLTASTLRDSRCWRSAVGIERSREHSALGSAVGRSVLTGQPRSSFAA